MAEEPGPSACLRCGGSVEPFGTMGHLFVADDGRPLCLSCAREFVPDKVELAEAYEARWNQSEKPSGKKPE